MRVRIENGSHRARAFAVPGGHATVPAGDAVELELKAPLSETKLADLAAAGVTIAPLDPSADPKALASDPSTDPKAPASDSPASTPGAAKSARAAESA